MTVLRLSYGEESSKIPALIRLSLEGWDGTIYSVSYNAIFIPVLFVFFSSGLGIFPPLKVDVRSYEDM